MPLGAWERAFSSAASLQIFARAPTRTVGTSRAEARRTSACGRGASSAPATPTRSTSSPRRPHARSCLRSPEGSVWRRFRSPSWPSSPPSSWSPTPVLVSVTQRMRDIGIRRALGAKRATIVSEVLRRIHGDRLPRRRGGRHSRRGGADGGNPVDWSGFWSRRGPRCCWHSAPRPRPASSQATTPPDKRRDSTSSPL